MEHDSNDKNCRIKSKTPDSWYKKYWGHAGFAFDFAAPGRGHLLFHFGHRLLDPHQHVCARRCPPPLY
eukprot:1397059-Rhodomonas_salina.1